MRAAIYCRISRDRKVDGGYTMLGVERQEQDCRELCGTLGWEVAEVFVDNDVSAVSGRVRPAYKAMLAAVRAGTVDAIICWHPDRLYRRTVDLEELVGVCDEHRVPIATVNAGNVDLTTPTGRLVAGLLAQVAKYEGEHKAERWRRSYRQRREAGTPATLGHRMFGWTTDGELVPEEAAAIKWVAQELIAGATVMGVVRGLQDKGLRTTRGNVWRGPALRKLLTNPRLAGWTTIKGEIVARSTWPPILDQAEWEAARRIITERQGGTQPPRKAILLGVAHCVCGARMISGSRGDKNPASRRVYRCPPETLGGSGCTSVGAEHLEHLVEGYAKERLADPRVRAALVALRSDGGAQKIGYEIANLEARLLELEAELSDNDKPVGALMRAMAAVEEKMTDARSRLAEVGAVALPADTDSWPADVPRRNALVRLAVENVVVDRAPAHDAGRPRFNPERVRIYPRR